MKRNYSPGCILLYLSLLFSACSKISKDPCNMLQELKIHPLAPVAIGEPLTISADHMDDAMYYWTGPLGFESTEENPTITSSAEYVFNGWYYVSISYAGCDTKSDSVYVDINFPQGTPSCTPRVNSADFSIGSLPDQRFNIIKFQSYLGNYKITCNSPNGDLYITMSDYWSTHDLEDGIYYTTASPIVDYYDLSKVHIADVNQSIYWVAEAGQPVFVSHNATGRQIITFCGLHFFGELGGNEFNTDIDAQVRQP